MFPFALILSGVAMVGALFVAVKCFGTVWSYSLAGVPWLAGNEAIFGIQIDALSCLMLLAITIVGFLVIMYSGRYMSVYNKEHPSNKGRIRYYFFMLLFIAAMMGLVISPNFFQLFIFWELTTLCSWGLISFYGDKPALQSGYKALLITHAAGLFLVVAIIILFINTGSFEFNAINNLPSVLKNMIIIFLLVAACGKAAQFPFFTWLPTAMAAPTPASAYLHAAAMVKAGIYLMARTLICVHAVPLDIGFVMGGGALLTMYIGLLFYFVQDDLKQLLAYSTITNLGYMMLGLSLGIMGGTTAFRGGLLHLINHSFTKSLLFLAVGAISCATGTRSISHLSGLSRKMPVTSLAFIIGALAISGVPPFNMFWSKFFIVAGAIQLSSSWGWAVAILVVAESIGGFVLFLRVAQKVFFGEMSPEAEEANDPPLSMLVPLLILIILSVVSTVFALPIIDQLLGG